MAATWLRSTSVALGAGTNAIIAVPTLAAVNQVMVLDVWVEDITLAGSITSSGFTVKYEDVVAGNGVRSILYKRLIGSDTGNYTVAWGGGSVTRQVTCHQTSGVFSTGDPWFGTSDLQAASGTVTVPATSVASVPDNSLGLLFIATDTVGTSTTPTTAWTVRYNVNKMAVFSKLHNVTGTGTLSASTTTWSTTAGAISVRLAALLEEPTGLPVDVFNGSLTVTGGPVTLGHTVGMPSEP